MSKLQEIIENKKIAVESLKSKRASVRFSEQLSAPGLSIIAEIKRASPSKGVMAEIASPVALATQYADAGASAISVLTEERYFNGSIDDLRSISSVLSNRSIAILRKDFIVDPIQLAEARMAGAHAVLLMVSVLGDRLKSFIDLCDHLSLEALVEVHDKAEIDIALRAGAHIIGVNNRDLKTLEVDTDTAFKLLDHLPKNCIKVAESGIHSAELAKAYANAGFDAVLVGEYFVKHGDPVQAIREMKGGSCR